MNAQLFFTRILGSGVQDLSCAAIDLDKSCIPFESNLQNNENRI
jgi:hypothetical protein